MPMKLREEAMLRLPGRYQGDDEDPFPPKNRPNFTHPHVEFNPGLSRHCAFPSLPFDHPGPGPSELWAAAEKARKKEEEDEEDEEDEDDEDEDDEEDESDHDERLILSIAKTSALAQSTFPSPASEAHLRRGHGSMASEEQATKAGLVAVIIRRPKTPTPEPDQLELSCGRRASCVSLSRKNSSQPRPPTDGGAGAQSRQTSDSSGSESMPMEATPQWSDLSDGMKYVILHEMTLRMSFTRASKHLRLSWGETFDVVEMVRQEMGKNKMYTEKLQEYDHMMRDGPYLEYNRGWLDDFIKIPHPPLLTDNITAREIKLARAFLNFLGLQDVAVKLGEYRGNTGEYYEIPLNHYLEDGYRSLIPHFNNGNREELLELVLQEKRERRTRTMSDEELHVRLDSPPGSINPKRLESRSQQGNGLNLEHVGHGIHPANFDLRMPDPEEIASTATVNELLRKAGLETQYPGFRLGGQGKGVGGGYAPMHRALYPPPHRQTPIVSHDSSEHSSSPSQQHQRGLLPPAPIPWHNSPMVVKQKPQGRNVDQRQAEALPVQQQMQVQEINQQQPQVAPASQPQQQGQAPGPAAASTPTRGPEEQAEGVVPADALLQKTVREILDRHHDVLKNKRGRPSRRKDSEGGEVAFEPPADEGEDDYSESNKKKKKNKKASAPAEGDPGLLKKARTGRPKGVTGQSRPLGRPRKALAPRDATRAQDPLSNIRVNGQATETGTAGIVSAPEQRGEESNAIGEPREAGPSGQSLPQFNTATATMGTAILQTQNVLGQPMEAPFQSQVSRHGEVPYAIQIQEWLNHQVPQIIQPLPGLVHDHRRFAPASTFQDNVDHSAPMVPGGDLQQTAQSAGPPPAPIFHPTPGYHGGEPRPHSLSLPREQPETA